MKEVYYEQTKTEIEKWIQIDGRKGYKKSDASSYEGFLYKKRDESTNRVITFDIRLPLEGSVLFEASFGIHIIDQAYLPAIKLYCQQIDVNYGSVQVDKMKAEVIYRVESLIMENPISDATLELFEKEAIRIFTLHFGNLKNLATGKVLDIKPVEEKKKKASKKVNITDSIESIREFLNCSSGHNSIGERIDSDDNTVFYSQVLTEKDAFRIEFIVSDDGILNLKGSYGDNAFAVAEPYKYLAASYLNDENSEHKYGALSIGNKTEGISCSVYTSLIDGPIGEITIKFIEGIIVKVLRESIENVEKLGVGITIPEDTKLTLIEDLLNKEWDKTMKNMEPDLPVITDEDIEDFIKENSVTDEIESIDE